MTDVLELLADRLDPPRATVDVFGLLGYEPSARQQTFHAALEWDVLYGGAAGGGKTRALLADGLRACVRYPGIAVLAIRESYPQLRDTFIAELAKVGYAKALGAAYNKTEHDLTFLTGSVLRFRHCDSLQDARLRLGSEIQLLLVDEATQQVPEAIQFLTTRLRTSSHHIPVLGIRLASNPGGKGHGWAKARYVDATNHGERTYEDTVDGKPTGHLVRFIPARHTDNPHLLDYDQVLNSIPDPRLRQAYRDGSWTTFEGQVFVEWDHDRHVVRPFTIPRSWSRLAGVDYGYAAPWCVLWAAADADRRVWVYRELYDTQVTEADQARRILAAEAALTDDGLLATAPAERPLRLADPAMWAKTGQANPPAALYAQAGVALGKAANDRLAGAARVHSFLADGPACPVHRSLGWTACPMLHVFDTCSNLIRTLPALPADTHRPEDVDTDAEDHAYDALRYLLMSLTPPRTRGEPVVPSPEWQMMTLDEKVKADLSRRKAGVRKAQRGMDSGLLGQP